MSKRLSKTRLAKAVARLAVPLATAQYWALLPVAVAEGLALLLEVRAEKDQREPIARLPASLGAALAEVHGLPEKIQTALQNRAAALVELVRREIAGLGLLDRADADVAQQVLAAFPERIAGTIAQFFADTAILTPRSLADGLTEEVKALLGPILGNEAESIAEHLSGAIVVALAQDPVLRGPFEEAHREETRELARSAQHVLDRMGELDESLLQLDRLVARAAGLPSAAVLAELVRWNKERMLDDHRRKLRRQLTRPLDEWRVQDLLEAEGLDRDGPETPRAYAYVPHTLERWDPRTREAVGEERHLSLNDLEVLVFRDARPGAVLVQAQAGFGKSTFLRWLANQWSERDDAPLPVFVTVAELTAAGYDLAAALRRGLSFPDDWDKDERLRQNAALGLVERGLAVVLVDGLDQLQGAPEKVLDAAGRSHGARVVAACREELGPGAGLAGWTALVRLRHPDPTAFDQLVDEDVRKALKNALAGDDVRHPFFLHVARTIQHTGGGGLPRAATAAKLLDRYVRRLLQHGEERACEPTPSLPRAAPVDPEDWQLDVLGTLGLESLRSLHGSGKGSDALQVTDGEVWKHARHQAEERRSNRLKEVEDFLDAARDKSHLLYLLERTDADGTYRFHHQLVQEYLGALGIALRVEESKHPIKSLIELVADVVSPRAVGVGDRGEPIESRVRGLNLWSMVGELLVTRQQELAKQLVLEISTWLLDHSEEAVSEGRFQEIELSPLLAVRDAMVEALDRSGVLAEAKPPYPGDPVVAQFETAGVPPDPFIVLCWEEERRRIQEQVASVADWLLGQDGVDKRLEPAKIQALREASEAANQDPEKATAPLAAALQELLGQQEQRLAGKRRVSWEVRPYGPTLAAFAGDADEPSWVLVPHGPFVAGDVGDSDELPVRVVDVKRPFWIGFDPVTVGEFAKFVGEDGYGEELEGPWWDPFRDEAKRALEVVADRRKPWAWDDQKGQAERPVVGVSWFEAAAYCLWRNGSGEAPRRWGVPNRLPGEAEWEKASRGLLGRRWSWGCGWRPGLVVCSEEGAARGRPADVRGNPNISPLAVRGTAGSTWEWTATKWEQERFGEQVELRDARDEDRISRRGGSFVVGRHRVRCAYRSGVNAWVRNDDLGFRCVRDVI